jgi:hypothetical protein
MVAVATHCRNGTFAAGPSLELTDDPELGITYMTADRRFIIVATDGACRNNGMEGAKSTYGVCFGRNSLNNDCDVLLSSYKQTNIVAEFYAAERAA